MDGIGPSLVSFIGGDAGIGAEIVGDTISVLDGDGDAVFVCGINVCFGGADVGDNIYEFDGDGDGVFVGDIDRGIGGDIDGGMVFVDDFEIGWFALWFALYDWSGTD